MKKNFTFKSILALLMLVFTVSGFSQQRTCASAEYMAEAMKDPVFAQQYKEDQKKFQAELARRANGDFSQRGGGTIQIPVAVHFPSGNEADRACLVALAQAQVDILNADYTATNTDINQWAAASAFYPGLQPGAANIEFCLAVSNHPPGVDPELLEGEPAVTIGYNFANGSGFPEQDANFVGYMNFLVKNIGAGLLGYSPGGGSLANGGAVVMNLGSFGSGAGCFNSGIVPQAPFNLGRTVTHELGHFYTLAHPWGPGGPSCATDDGFADTPNTGQETYNCPAPGSQAGCVAGQNVLHMNYMDYVNDACMYMFTPQQMNAVDAYITSVIAPAIKPNVCEPADPGFNISGANISTCGDEAVFNLTYTQIQGFSENTVFTASGNPGGTSVSFSPNNLSVNGSFEMTVSNIGGLAEGDYTITVTGTSASVTKDVDFTLSIISDTCPSVANTQFATSVTGVVFGDISNLNTGKPSGYSDYTQDEALDTDVNRESSYDLTVNVNTDGNFRLLTRVWIDWNQNCSFDDPGEMYELGEAINTPNGPTADSPLSITVPSDAALGATTMRVATKYTPPGQNDVPTSCENNHDAEVEDYTVTVMTSLSVGENEFENFAIFPNPNRGAFTIQLNSDSQSDIDVDVFDIRGRRIFENSFTNTREFNQTVNLNNVQSGVYLVTVSDGLKTTTKRIIIQ